jgi:hypothetical protein
VIKHAATNYSHVLEVNVKRKRTPIVRNQAVRGVREQAKENAAAGVHVKSLGGEEKRR